MSLSNLPDSWTLYEVIQDVMRVITAIAAIVAAAISFNASRQIREIHVSINGKMDDLLKLTAKSSHAEGVEQERIDNERRND